VTITYGNDYTPDATGRNNNLLLSTTPPTFSTAGMAVQANQMAGSLDTADLRAPAGSFSVWGWVYPTVAPGTARWVIAKTGATGEWAFNFDVAGTLTFYVVNAAQAAFPVTSLSPLTINVWTFFYGQWDSPNNLVGISLNNGTLVTAAGPGPGNVFASTDPFGVGGRQTDGNNPFTGYLAGCGKANQLLTAGDLTYLSATIRQYNDP
jgi:hypothetical protein